MARAGPASAPRRRVSGRDASQALTCGAEPAPERRGRRIRQRFAEASPPLAAVWTAGALAGCAAGGLDARLGSAALAVALCASLLARLSAPAARSRLFDTPVPVVAALLFASTLLWSVLQATPGVAPPHPAWSAAGVSEVGPAALFPLAARVETVKLFGLGAAFLIGVAAGRDPWGLDAVMRALLIAGAAYAGVALVHYGVARATLADPGGRLMAGLPSANAAGLVFGVVVIAAAAALLRTVSRGAIQGLPPLAMLDGVIRAAPVSAAAFALAGGALMLTASRAATALTLAGLVVLAAAEALSAARDRQTRGAAAALVAAAATLAALFGGGLAVRWETLALAEDPRLIMMTAHARAAGEALLVGHGFGAFGVVNNLAMTVETVDALAPIGAAHNVYLQWVEEAGLLGAAPFFIALIILIGPVLRAAARPGRQRHWRRAGAVIVIVVAIHAGVDFALNIYAIACLAALGLGALWAAALARRTSSEAAPERALQTVSRPTS